ncbi:MAG: metallophosphoesterase [Nitrospirota bacterium]|nr:metallophosphoesterase [Nitrospirota bacterium]
MTKISPWLLGMMAMAALFSMAYPAHAKRTTAFSSLPEIPETIFAAGDIAKCNGDHSKWEEFLKVVGLLPESAGEESEEKEPFLHKLLELVGWIEETDYYANAEETASLLKGLKGWILALGDLGYPIGSSQSFNKCYDRAWGPLKDRTYPVPGNHEYNTKDAVPYFAYWGSRAGEAGKGYYSFDLSGWHLIALNSKLEKNDGGDTISAQHVWLQQDLAATKAKCILAYWHHPVFSSGQHGGSQRMKNLLQTLYANGVSVVLKGHDHDYERFALQNAEGGLDPARGFRAFVVGTGGAPLRTLETRQKNSEFFQADTFGVLKLELYSDRYAWEFLPVGGNPPLDTGTGSCVLPKKG